VTWQPRIKVGAGSKFMGLVAALEEDILTGLVGEGDRMPPQRAVAEALGIDLTTVTRAYNEAKTRGLLTASAGRGGTRIADRAGGPARRALTSPVDLSMKWLFVGPSCPDFRGGREREFVLVGGTLVRCQCQHKYSAGAPEGNDRLTGPARQGRPPGGGKLASHAELLIRWVEANSDITMPELAAKLEAARGVELTREI
jgi:transposase